MLMYSRKQYYPSIKNKFKKNHFHVLYYTACGTAVPINHNTVKSPTYEPSSCELKDVTVPLYASYCSVNYCPFQGTVL